MRISSSWLQQLVRVPAQEELAQIFEMAGIGVEECDGEIFSLEITSNRGDWLSAVGLAREIGAMTGKKLRVHQLDVEEPETDSGFAVEIESNDDCPRYYGRLIEAVRVGPSPDWLQQRLAECGIRSINNVVDITNFVMLECGQPLHAFDADKLSKADGNLPARIHVRRARAGEVLVTLDGVERSLTTESLVIADSENAIALAGVMGGQSTEVSEDTTRVLLESAHFAGARVRRTAKDAGLTTEASRRFERWVDPNGAKHAADRATLLLQEFAAAEVRRQAVDNYATPIIANQVSLRVSRCNAVLGLKLSPERIVDCLQRLCLDVGNRGEVLNVAVPTFRRDIVREIDLIEEVARIHGYQDIPITLPKTVNSMAGRSLSQRLEERAKSALLRCGLSEIITYSMQSAGAVARAGMPAVNSVLLRNPLSDDYTQMRTSMLPSMLEVLGKNARRGARLFELAKVYLPREGQKQPDENRRIAVALLEEVSPARHWQGNHSPHLDLFFGKGVVESMLCELGAPRPQWRSASQMPFHPGRCSTLEIDGQDLGIVGQVHPEVADRYDLPARACLAEIDFDGLVRHLALVKVYRPLDRFPAIERDLALVLPAGVRSADIEAVLRSASGPLLHSISTFDVYSGPPVPSGHKSVGITLSYRSEDRTLTDLEIEGLLSTARAAAEAQFGASLR